VESPVYYSYDRKEVIVIAPNKGKNSANLPPDRSTKGLMKGRKKQIDDTVAKATGQKKKS